MNLKKSDITLIVTALVALLFLTGMHWIILIKILVAIVLLLILLYWKVFPYKNLIDGKYKSIFNAVDSALHPILSRLSSLPQIRLGTNLCLESGCLFITFILILTLIIL